MGEVIAFPAPHEPVPAAPAPEPLWREAVGHELREERTRAGRTLSDVAETSGVSLQYLSEIERGRKEPSSEMIAAVAGALGTSLVDLTTEVAEHLRGAQDRRGALLLAA